MGIAAPQPQPPSAAPQQQQQQQQPATTAKAAPVAAPAAVKMPLTQLHTNAQLPPQTGGAAKPAAPTTATAAPYAVSGGGSGPSSAASSSGGAGSGGGARLAPSAAHFAAPAADEATARSMLAGIFKRIAEKDTQVRGVERSRRAASTMNLTPTLQALVDLYFFKEANPDNDMIEAMLSNASAVFKTFIMRGLHKVVHPA